MKYVLIALALLATPAHAETVQTTLTACTTEDAIEAFTQHAYINKEDPKTVLAELGDLCKLSIRIFEPGEDIKTLSDRKYNYTILSIQVIAEGEDLGDGIIMWTAKPETLYAMRYSEHPIGQGDGL